MTGKITITNAWGVGWGPSINDWEQLAVKKMNEMLHKDVGYTYVMRKCKK